MIIEPLRADSLERIADVHLDAFSGYLNARLGKAYAKSFLAWFTRDPNAIALVARDDQGEAIGYVVGAFDGYARRMNRDLFWRVAVSTASRPWLLLNPRFLRAIPAKLTAMFRRRTGGAAPAVLAPTMSLVGVGIARQHRGRGAGAMLIAAFEERARELGARSMTLSVYPDNVVARRAYERSGWSLLNTPAQPAAAVYYSKTIE